MKRTTVLRREPCCLLAIMIVPDRMDLLIDTSMAFLISFTSKSIIQYHWNNNAHCSNKKMVRA
jgi:hypothetical protein